MHANGKGFHNVPMAIYPSTKDIVPEQVEHLKNFGGIISVTCWVCNVTNHSFPKVKCCATRDDQ